MLPFEIQIKIRILDFINSKYILVAPNPTPFYDYVGSYLLSSTLIRRAELPQSSLEMKSWIMSQSMKIAIQALQFFFWLVITIWKYHTENNVKIKTNLKKNID